MPRTLRWSQGELQFLMREVSLYAGAREGREPLPRVAHPRDSLLLPPRPPDAHATSAGNLISSEKLISYMVFESQLPRKSSTYRLL